MSCEEKKSNIREWSDVRIQKEIRENIYFRKGLVNLFFEGSTIPILSKVLPLFELKKLSISKLKFEVEALLDTMVRYKEKGSYSGKKQNNPEVLIIVIDIQDRLWYHKHHEFGECCYNHDTFKFHTIVRLFVSPIHNV